MTKKYTLKELHEMSGIKIPTLNQRMKIFDIEFKWGIDKGRGFVRTKILELDDESLKLMINPNKLGRYSRVSTPQKYAIDNIDKKQIKEDMQSKCRENLREIQEQWMILLGFFPLPKIKARASYIHKEEV